MKSYYTSIIKDNSPSSLPLACAVVVLPHVSVPVWCAELLSVMRLHPVPSSAWNHNQQWRACSHMMEILILAPSSSIYILKLILLWSYLRHMRSFIHICAVCLLLADIILSYSVDHYLSQCFSSCSHLLLACLSDHYSTVMENCLLLLRSSHSI